MDRPEWQDTTEILKERKRWLNEEIRKIDIALAALEAAANGGQPSQNRQSKRPTIQWSDKVDQVFAKNDGELGYTEVCRELVKLGVPEALDPSYKASIIACLSRKTQQGKLSRVRPGYYRAKRRTPVLGTETKNEGTLPLLDTVPPRILR